MLACPTCGKSFEVSGYAVANGRRYCSRACAADARPKRVGRHRCGRVAEYYPFVSKRAWDSTRRQCAGIVREAIRVGDLIQQPCEVCGEFAEAHHEDYGHPLSVRWLCRTHHREHHAELRAKGLGVAASTLPFQRKKQRHSHTCDASTVALVRQVTGALAGALSDSGLTEMALAERLHISRQAMNASFAGGFRTLKLVAAVAEGLDCDISVSVTPRAARRERAS